MHWFLMVEYESWTPLFSSSIQIPRLKCLYWSGNFESTSWMAPINCQFLICSIYFVFTTFLKTRRTRNRKYLQKTLNSLDFFDFFLHNNLLFYFFYHSQNIVWIAINLKTVFVFNKTHQSKPMTQKNYWSSLFVRKRWRKIGQPQKFTDNV